MNETQSSRVHALIDLSEKTYAAIDGRAGEMTRADRIVRLGMATAAQLIEQPYGLRVAGDQYHRLLVHELEAGGLGLADPAYDAFGAYREIVTGLPRHRFPIVSDVELDELAARYAQVERLTLDRRGGRELNASHVAHLSALGLAYAAEFHPELDQSRLALYFLLHDILEAYAGDTPSLGASDEIMSQKDLAEAAALERIEQEFAGRYPTLVQTLKDYEHLIDDEARYAKTFDKLDPGFTHYYSHGQTLIEDLNFTSEAIFRRNVDAMTRRITRAGYAKDYPGLLADRDVLTDYIAAQTPWPN
jgi:5'-deoxynucleotidase YfbR-like HD superfamily hydrolase